MDKKAREAVSRAGGAARLARQLKISRQAVTKWRRVPLRHLDAVEAASGMAREELRPDIWSTATRSDAEFRATALELAIKSGVASSEYLNVAERFLLFLRSETPLVEYMEN